MKKVIASILLCSVALWLHGQNAQREPLINRDVMEFRGETVVSIAELTALRAENAALKARVASLEKTVQELIEQQQRGANLRIPRTTP